MVVNKPEYKWVIGTLGILSKISNNCRGADKFWTDFNTIQDFVLTTFYIKLARIDISIYTLCVLLPTS